MARARNIKPGFCRNEDLAECSAWARLCFLLLPMLADREGRLEDRPKRIKGELFPFDTVDVDPLLDELDSRGFIARYTVGGVALIQILAFLKHQNPHHRENESTLPPHPSLRLDADGKWVKPEALPSSEPTEALGKPQASPRLDPPRVDLARGSNPADSLIPDSGFSDSGFLIPEEDPPTPKGGVVRKFPPGFDTFWAAYPRKVAKDSAAKAFAKRKPDAALLAQMLAAIERQRASDQWRRDGGTYIPHPATWLNAGRWEDEADDRGTGSGRPGNGVAL